SSGPVTRRYDSARGLARVGLATSDVGGARRDGGPVRARGWPPLEGRPPARRSWLAGRLVRGGPRRHPRGAGLACPRDEPGVVVGSHGAARPAPRGGTATDRARFPRRRLRSGPPREMASIGPVLRTNAAPASGSARPVAA